MQGRNQNPGKVLYAAAASDSSLNFFPTENEDRGVSCPQEAGGGQGSWSDLHALRKLYRLVHVQDDLDERSRSLLRRLLDEATQRAIHSDLEGMAAPPTADGTARDPANSEESRVRRPCNLLPKPPASGSERPTERRGRADSPCRPLSRGGADRVTALSVGAGTTESVPGRKLTRPEAAAGRRVNPDQATVHHKRNRAETAELPLTPPRKDSGLTSGSTRAGPPRHRAKTEIRSTGRSDLADRTAERSKQLVIRKETPVRARRSGSGRRERRLPIRELGGRRVSPSSGTSCGCESCAVQSPRGRGSGSSSDAAAPPRRPRRGAVARQEPVRPSGVFRKSGDPRGIASARHSSSASKREVPPALRPATKEKNRPQRSPTMTKKKSRSMETEKKDGRLRRIKNKLGLIFLHHHHHHHHHPSSDSEKGGDEGRRRRRRMERRHHRSLGELLRGLLHHSGVKPPEGGLPPPPRPERERSYAHALLEGLLRHVWRRNRRENRPARLPQPRRKLHWWQRIRRRRGVRLTGRRKSRLKLGIGRRPSHGHNGVKNRR